MGGAWPNGVLFFSPFFVEDLNIFRIEIAIVNARLFLLKTDFFRDTFDLVERLAFLWVVLLLLPRRA